ncbi:MAG TPA: M12 family metallo-peptidase [Flavobacterium sp.]|uniref:M12 family metallo-peptidase n=1 Tax=Flavobacterium sp. TaxID=239 RepID=UPI002CC1D1D3|nr:M12 family metallo-peptidase [Flavobacterium sp.]HSD15570.1 M12 family metallo-peptidase [Flavobacterium sp.]
MKKLITITVLCCSLFAFSQNKVASKVRELNLSKTEFVPVLPLNSSDKRPNIEIEQTVTEAQLATIKASVVNDVVQKGYQTIELQLPYHGSILQIQLYKVDLFAEGFHVDTDKQKNINYNKGVYYRGIIKNDPNSLASFNFFNGEFNGVVSSSLLSNLVIGKIDKPGNTSEYIIYEDQKMKVASSNDCHTSDELTGEKENITDDLKSPNSTKCVATYFEIDNNLFVSNGSDTTTTTNWMTSVFNNMQTLYTNDGITVSLKSVYIWTTLDPYEGIGTGSSDYLYKFKEVRPVFDGDVGQLVGIDPGGLGGVSMGIGGLCTTNNYVYSDVYLSYSTVPTYSWTIQVITHEFGHNIGSRHTHACAWNGNNTAIDNCAPYALGSSAEGYSCMTTPPTIPSSVVKGSIMSYCHLVSGVGISLANGFGPQPSTAILNFVNSRGCLSTDCIAICVNGVGAIDAQYNAASTSAVVTWTDVTVEDTWQVAVLPFSSNTPTWNTVTAPTFTAYGLSPNTYYKFRVKPNCGSLTPLTREYIFLTSANYCDGITIADTGGISGAYTNNQNFVRTIIPNLSNKKIRLDFTSFSLEQDYDYLYVYNGSSTASPSFAANGYTGTTVPGPLESSAPDGALTLRFFSDGGVTDQGWVATTSCLTNLGINENNYIDYSYYPNPTNGVVTINSKDMISNVMVYNVQGRLLFSGDVNNLTTQVDISGYASGTYFFKMKIDNQTVNFKVVKL